MPIVDLPPGAGMDVARGDAVVCIPLYSGHDHFLRCIRSVLAHTPPGVPVLVADDATPEPSSRAFLGELEDAGTLEHTVWWLRRAHNAGFVENVNDAFAAAGAADVVILNSDVVVAEGWLEGLRDAATSDTTIATATALTNHGTILSVPYRNRPLPRLPMDLTLDDAARRVRDRALRARPRIPSAIGHCVYIRRAALDLVGPFDLAFAPGYGEEVDFSQRCLAVGLQHVVADDVFVVHHGGGSFGMDRRTETQVAHEKLINLRYPYYAPAVQQVEADPQGPLAQSLGGASRALRGLRVTVDGRSLGTALTGTQIHTLELIAALWRTEQVRLRVLLPDHPGTYVAPALRALPGVETITSADVEAAEADDIVHRPWQVGVLDDLALLGRLGTRLVVTQQDLIAYRNPSYFPTAAAWMGYRQLAADAAALASMVLFFSQHARDDALAEELVPASRAQVVPLGTDHTVSVRYPEPRPPKAFDGGGAPFLLCLGTDFRHKNRVFALRVFEALRERHGWPGRLVLAGPTVEYGSSSADEAAFLARRPQLARSLVQLPAVTEEEKSWLITRSVAVLYPTTYEGFGLVPFEAAEHGRPCLFARQASLVELFDEDAALIVPWDPAATADRVIGVLRDSGTAAAQVDRVASAGVELTWSRTAQALLTAYDQALRLSPRAAARANGRSMATDARYWTLRNQIGPTGLSLVGPDDPDGPLLPEDVQRLVAGLARRPATRAVLFRTLRALGRARSGLGDRAGEDDGLPGG